MHKDFQGESRSPSGSAAISCRRGIIAAPQERQARSHSGRRGEKPLRLRSAPRSFKSPGAVAPFDSQTRASSGDEFSSITSRHRRSRCIIGSPCYRECKKFLSPHIGGELLSGGRADQTLLFNRRASTAHMAPSQRQLCVIGVKSTYGVTSLPQVGRLAPLAQQRLGVFARHFALASQHPGDFGDAGLPV